MCGLQKVLIAKVWLFALQFCFKKLYDWVDLVYFLAKTGLANNLLSYFGFSGNQAKFSQNLL